MRPKAQAERDAYNAKRREERAAHKDVINAHRRWLYANDEEFREKCKRRQRERRHTDDYRAKTALQRRLRYASDPEFRARVLEGGRRYRERRKGEGGCGTSASSQG